MLSRKQTWRKLRSKSGEAIFKFCDGSEDSVASESNSEGTSNMKIDSDDIANCSNSDSCSNSNGQPKTPIKKLRSALSMGDLSKALRRSEDARNLRFSSKVHVCLIPTRQDLFSVAKDVFWHSDDYQTFKREAVDELRAYLQLKGITAKEAIQALYQPQPEEYSYLRNLSVNRENNEIETSLPRTGSSPAIMENASAASTNATSDSNCMEACEGGDSCGDDIKLGFKTDLDMNKELGTIKTPARQGGANSGAWAVQWQAPVPTV